MRRLAVLMTAAWLVTGLSSRAEEPYLDFVRALREKHGPDLALDYLGQLSKNPPPGFGPLILLEIAKTRLEKASVEPNVPKRLALYLAARTEFETFLKNNPNHAQAPEARLQMARVTVMQGKTQLNQALREEGAARESSALKARAILVEAGKQLQEADKQIAEALQTRFKEEPKSEQDKVTRKTLQTAEMQARLEQAINFLDLAQTYVKAAQNLEEQKTRSEIAGKAKPILEKLADGGDKNPFTWQARAWQGRILQETGVPKEARKKFNSIIAEKAPEAAAGQRLARYFLMLVLPEAAEAKENLYADIQKVGEEWLRLYRPFEHTPEGYGVRYELADAYLKQGQASKVAGQQRAFFDKALEQYRQLEATENEYADKARQQKVRIIFANQGTRANVNALATFDDCYVRAQYEYVLINEEAGKKDPKFDQKRKAHLETITTALKRGVDLAASDKRQKFNPADLQAAKALLAYTYLETKHYPEAQALAEEVSRLRPPSSSSARAALYAMIAYPLLEDKGKELQELAEYAEKTWPDEQAGFWARHELSRLLMKKDQTLEAIDKLSQIKPDYSRYIIAQVDLANAALTAQRDKIEPKGPDKRPFQDRAQEALQRMPAVAPGSDVITTHYYIQGRLMLGGLLVQGKSYQEALTTVKAIEEQFPELPEELKLTAARVRLAAVYSLAQNEYNAGNYTKARELIDPDIEKLKAGGLAELKKAPELRLAVLSLGLRGNVQDGKIAKAKEILKLLQDGGGDDLGSDSSKVLLSLVQSLREQIKDLRKQGPKAQAQLEKMVSSFSAFLDELGKQEKMPVETLMFLAQSYSSLDMHDKAAALLEKVQEPKLAEGAEPDAKALSQYRGGKLLHARELRLAKKFDFAGQALKEIEGQPWGKNVQVTKEKLLLLEDQEKYAGRDGSMLGWDSLRKTLYPKMAQDPAARELYWEAYYHVTYCMFKAGEKLPNGKKREEQIRKAASFITELENRQADWGGEASKKRFEELLASEAELKKHYDALKHGTK